LVFCASTNVLMPVKVAIKAAIKCFFIRFY
jgi:hypothetical protein